MKRYFYFVARFFKNGIEGMSEGIQESGDGSFDIISAKNAVSKRVGVREAIITFWTETNSVMFGKFGGKI